ncbi:MAG: hypothetical protein AAGF99_10390 [Bacteroidota bacterium]
MRFLAVFLLCSCLGTTPAFAQPLGGLDFELVELPHSPEGAALGNAIVATPTGDAQGFLSNPAHLAHDTDGISARLSLLPQTDWLGVDGLSRFGFALNAGADGRRWGLPLVLGLGIVRSGFDLGEALVRYGPGTQLEFLSPITQSFTAVSAGLSYVGPVRASLGLGVRWADHAPGTTTPVEGTPETVVYEATMYDIGVLGEVPIAHLVGWHERYGAHLDVRVGYARTSAQSNSGEAPSCFSPAPFTFGTGPSPCFVAQAPATVRLGWAASFGSTLRRDLGTLRLFSVTLAFQADEVVSELGEDTPWTGSFSALDALLGQGERSTLDGTDHVGRRAAQLTIAETLTTSYGSFTGAGTEASSYGFTLSLGGLARAIGLYRSLPHAYDLGQRFDLRLTGSVYVIDEDAFSVTEDVQRFLRSNPEATIGNTVFWGTTLRARLP